MKKILLIFAFLLMNTNIGTAVPLTIINNSDTQNSVSPFDAHVYLGFYKEGGTCAEDVVLYFVFEAGSVLQIDDGSFIYNSPLNNYQECLSFLLGDPSCSPMPLDWDGQRFWLEEGNGFYPAGIIGLSTGSVDCQPASFPIGSSTSPNLNFNYEESLSHYTLVAENMNNVEVCEISYKRYGNVLAVLSYE